MNGKPLLNLFLFLFSLSIFSQSNERSEIYTWFDNEVGKENTSLFNGIEYVDIHRVVNDKHKFYKSPQFSLGSIIYDGQPFYNIPLKYDIFDDVVIVKVEHQLGSSLFQLLTEKISEFNIGDENFIYLDGFENVERRGIYQVLNGGKTFSMYKRNRKKMFQRKNDQSAYYEFEELDPVYVFNYLDQLYSYGTRGDLIAVFPEFEEEIKKMYKSKRKKLKDAPDLFMTELSVELIQLISSKNRRGQE